jgi:hypothetical protein
MRKALQAATTTIAQGGMAQGGIATPGTRSGGTAAGVLPAVAVVAFLLAAGEALGCPNCKDAVNTADPEGLNVARGYFYSILIMLAMPLTLVGSFGIYVWREMRRQERLAAEPPDAAGAADASLRRFDSALMSPPT